MQEESVKDETDMVMNLRRYMTTQPEVSHCYSRMT